MKDNNIRLKLERSLDEDELINRSYLELETLLMNILGNQNLVVINDVTNESYEGIESKICLDKEEWLSMRVSNIYIKNNKIFIHIDNDKYLEINEDEVN